MADRSDGELLREFMAHRAETAEASFSALVGRHGPMVWRVCRSVLADVQDAEDAFQATFMVLVQHARSVRRQDSLASWLYGVAYRVACCARSAAARRRRHEYHAVLDRPPQVHQSEPQRKELRAIIAEELNRLSVSHRMAVVLCDLEDLTHEQAAARLGWPVGTVKSRLARGRERLRSRLIRRGLAPSVALAGVVLRGDPGFAAAPLDLVSRSVRFALSARAGLSVMGSLSGIISSLSREDSNAMWISKLRWAALLVLGSGALGLGAAFLWQRTEARQPPAARSEAPVPSHRIHDDDATWARHAGNLKRIGLALHNYQTAEAHFPPAAITGKQGEPLLSWRVALLPYLEDYDGHDHRDLYKAFRLDEPWDSAHNKALLARMPAVFASPGKRDQQPFATTYRGFVSHQEETPQAAMATGMGMMGGGGNMQGMGNAMGRRQMQLAQGMAGKMGGTGMMSGMGMMSERMNRGRMMGGMMGGVQKKGVDVRNEQRKTSNVEAEAVDKVEPQRSEQTSKPAAQTAGPQPQEGVEVTPPAGGGAGGGMASMMAAMMGGRAPQEASSFGSMTLFRENRGVGIQEITDGTSNTIMVVEAAEAVPWTKPDDLPYSGNRPLPRLGGSMRDGFAVLFADGRVRMLKHGVDERIIRNLITASGGEIMSADDLPDPSAPPGGLSVGNDRGGLDELRPEESERYAGAGTLQNAVGILKDTLKREGKSELAEWLSEPAVRRTIRAGLKTYETFLRQVGEPELARQQFEIAKPVCRQIADEGIWPADSWFQAQSNVQRREGITYDHHQVRLVLERMHRGKPFPFTLLVLDVFYGPVEGPSPVQPR
jgi:RNA polymerase sigma factor (sigma-70 family)